MPPAPFLGGLVVQRYGDEGSPNEKVPNDSPRPSGGGYQRFPKRSKRALGGVPEGAEARCLFWTRLGCLLGFFWRLLGLSWAPLGPLLDSC